MKRCEECKRDPGTPVANTIDFTLRCVARTFGHIVVLCLLGSELLLFLLLLLLAVVLLLGNRDTSESTRGKMASPDPEFRGGGANLGEGPLNSNLEKYYMWSGGLGPRAQARPLDSLKRKSFRRVLESPLFASLRKKKNVQ